MAVVFLIIIYLTFIGLGLPDSILGSAWPVMRIDLNAGIDSAGIISLIVTGGTIVSSLLSHKLIQALGTAKITAFSVLITAVSLLGFSFSPSFIWLVFLAIPLGLGAGAVDAALNNYVAIHYSARHMNWLHSFWGIGAIMGPLILSFFINQNSNWRFGYLTIALIQVAIAVMLFASLPIWKKYDITVSTDNGNRGSETKNVFKIHGIGLALLICFLYNATELTIGLWCSSYFVEAKSLSPAFAAIGASLFYVGITVGRFLTGLLSSKIKSQSLILSGIVIIITAVLGIAFLTNPYWMVVAISIIGLGCAPIFPGMLHDTPMRFGESNSQRIIGMQMAFGYCGSTFIPPLIGTIITNVGLIFFPIAIIVLGLSMLILSLILFKAKVKQHIA